MKKLLIILLLIVGCAFGEDELTDRRVISFNIGISPNYSLSTKDSKAYEWWADREIDGIKMPLTRDRYKLFSSIFYIRPNDFGGYINFGFHKESTDNTTQATEEQAMNAYHGNWKEVPIVDFIHLETGITYQPIKNISGYSGLSLTSVDYFNGDTDMTTIGYYVNSKKYIGMSFGVILIPYQTKQYSSLTVQLGYSHSFGFGSGFDLGIGYRI